MKIKDVESIVNLLDDPDDKVYKLIVADIMSAGNDVVPLLEDAWYKSANPTVQKRIEHIVQQLQHNEALEGLTRWMAGDAGDILEGAYWVSRFQYPTLSLLQLRREVEQLRMTVWLRSSGTFTPSEQLNTINTVLFDEFHFRADVESPLNHELCYINRLLDSKVGNPISLSILYMAIAQRLELPVFGVRIPSSFILGFRREADKQPLFYINPANYGKLLQKSDVRHYIEEVGVDYDDSYMAACSNQQTILRLLETLVFTYEQEENREKTELFQQLLNEFEK